MLPRPTHPSLKHKRFGPRGVFPWAVLLLMPSCASYDEDPELRVTPSTFTIAPLDDQALVSVRNVGASELVWTATSQTEWITLVSPGEGRLAAGESEDVTLSFDAEMMSFGATTGEVRFSANGRIPTWSIAVTLDVACPGAVAEPQSGAVWVEGETRQISWKADGAGRVSLELVVGSKATLIASDEINDGSFAWVVDAGGLASGQCLDDYRVRVAPEGRQDCDRYSEPFCVRNLSCVTPPEPACAPSPGDQASGIPSTANLAWSCGTSPCNLPVTYQVYFGTNPNPGANEDLGTTSEKEWDLPPLEPSVTYYWKIVTQDGNGLAASPVWEFVTGGPPCTSPPETPCSPSPNDGTMDVPVDTNLTWNCGDSPCALSVTYRVYFGTNPNPGVAELVGSTSSKSWDLPPLAEDTHYYWKIEAEDANGTTPGPVWDFTTPPPPCVAPPTAPCTPLPADGAVGTSFDVDLAWSCGDSPCALPVTYRVHFGTNPNPGFVGSTSSKTWDLPALVPETHYFWRIDAEDENGTTPGPVWDFTTAAAPCVALPTAACAPTPSDDASDLPLDANLAWSCGDSQCALAVTYHVYFGTIPTPGPAQFLGTMSKKTFDLPALTPETDYYWRIDAEDANGVTTGPVWDFTTGVAPCVALPTAPCNPAPGIGGTGVPPDVNLAWSCGDSQCALAVTYRVYFGTNPDPGIDELEGMSSNKSWDLLPLAYDTHYYWKIEAEDANGVTSSPVWDFTTVAAPCVATPTAACGPVPGIGGVDVPTNADLAWSCGDSQCALAVTYHVYFGTDPTPDGGELQGSTPSKTWNLPLLAHDTHYYWRIVAEDENGPTTSAVWDFTTAAAPCVAAPTTPCSPVPGDGGTDLPTNVNLAWSCGDSQCALAVTYHVYFGTDPTPDGGELQGSTPSKTWNLPLLADDTHYYWKIEAEDANGVTSSAVWDFTTAAAPCVAAPTAPCGPVPGSGGTDLPPSVDLAWSCGDSQCGLAVTYRVYFGTDPTPGGGELQGSTASKTWNLPLLADDTHYYWRIEAEDANGTTSSPVWDFTTAAAPCVAAPTAPCGPVPGRGGTDLPPSVDLAWSCGDSHCGLAVTYRVYFGTDPNPDVGEFIGTTESKTWDLGILAHDTHYYWRIEAEDANGTTSSPVWDFTTAAAPCVAAPTAPCNPVPALGGTDVPTDTDLAWSCGDTQCVLPVTYSVYFGTNPNPDVGEFIGTTESKTWDLGILAHDTHYYWKIEAEDANGTSSSPVWDFTTDPAPCVALPTAPCGPVPGSGETDVSADINLEWYCGDSQCGLAVTYSVYFGTNADPGKTELVGTTNDKTWNLPHLAENTQYFWRIEATDANGTTPGPVWNFTTAPAPCTDLPTAPCNPSPADGAEGILPILLTLTWDCGQSQCFGSVAYDVYFGTDSNPEHVGRTSSQMWANLLVQGGTRYYWRIEAVDGNGVTSSPVWEFETAGLLR